MAIKRNVFIAGGCIGIVLCGIFLIKGYPIVFKSSEKADVGSKYDTSVFNPLDGYNDNDGDWAVYLIVDKGDFKKLTPELKQYKVWKASSSSVLKEIQNSWNFKPTGGDMATVSSSMIVVHEQKIVFEAGIVLDQDVIGLQSKEFGWAEPIQKDKFARSLRAFKKVQSPFVFI